LDESKYVASTIKQLFQAVLYHWSDIHKQDLSQLGKLNVVTSMPPGQYQKPGVKKQAEDVYRSVFKSGQSHMKIRPAPGEAHQIVTQFGGLVREATLFGQDIPSGNELVLVVDLGGGTTDFVLFNGSNVPIDSRTVNNGLFHTYQKIDYINPQRVELRIMSNKKYFPNQLLAYYNTIQMMIQAVIRPFPKPPDKIYIIGGGANLMPAPIKNSFKKLAKKVVVKDQYINAIANHKEASKNV
jgi:hypothetical protein